MMVAEGAYGGWICQSSHIWDCVAPQLIIEEAGGTFTDFFGRPMDYSDPLKRTGQNFTQCAAPPTIYRQLQQIINKKTENLIS
jgi:myo-inositol-1(or 4)-monophosphatase